MDKGFTLVASELAKKPGDLTHGLKTISRTLMNSIGGAMGPLYGTFFRGLAKGSEGKERIDDAVFGEMLGCSMESLRSLSQAQVGDKTLMDAFLPAVEAYRTALVHGKGFRECLELMAQAAEKGRDSTRNLVAKVGRASRLGERSRGTQDAGATSCALLLRTMADSIKSLIQRA
jgi:dihydroxyacetone kinase-like protein